MKTVQNNCFTLASTSHRSGCYVRKLTKCKDSITKNKSFDLIHDNFQTSAPKNTKGKCAREGTFSANRFPSLGNFVLKKLDFEKTKHT